MKIYWNKAAWAVLVGSSLLTACKKNDTGQLNGPVAQPSFTVTTTQVGLTTVATFTNTSTYSGEGTAFYTYDFGDNTTGKAGAPGTSLTHVYSSGGTKQAQLLSSARGGNAFSATRAIVLPNVLALVKNLLTGGSSKTWTLDNTVGNVISVGPNDSDVKSYYPGNPVVGSVPDCQADDEYTFTNANEFTYDAKLGTYVAGGVGCSAPRSHSDTFTFTSTTSGIAQLDFASPTTFIGVTDAPDQTYRIMSISSDGKTMVMRAGKVSANIVFEMKLRAK